MVPNKTPVNAGPYGIVIRFGSRPLFSNFIRHLTSPLERARAPFYSRDNHVHFSAYFVQSSSAFFLLELYWTCKTLPRVGPPVLYLRVGHKSFLE